VIQLFNIHRVGMIAGSMVMDGKVVIGSNARLLRDNVVIYDGRISSLKRFKDDVKDCSNGLECGIKIENFNDIKLGISSRLMRLKKSASVSLNPHNFQENQGRDPLILQRC